MMDKERFDLKNIKSAPQEQIEEYKFEIQEILRVLGHPEAFYTDWSMVTDFSLQPYPELIELIRENFGVTVDTPAIKLYVLAMLIREQSSTKQ